MGGNVPAPINTKSLLPRPIYVPTPLANTKLRTGIARVIAGTQRLRAAVLGDSTEMGRGGGTAPGPYANYDSRFGMPATYAAKFLNASGIPARADSWFGNSYSQDNTLAGLVFYNPSLTFGADWALAPNTATLGGAFINSSGTSSITYVPDRAADRFDVYYAIVGGGGTFTVSDSSGVLATINTSGTNSTGKTTVARATASITPISIQRTTGGAIYFSGVDPWNSTLPEVCFLNLAVAGQYARYYTDTSQAYNAAYALPLMAPDVSFIEYGLNEANNGVTLATYQSNLQTLITQQAAVSGVTALGISAPALSTSPYNLPTTWRNAIAQIGANNGLPVVDFYSLFGSRELDTSIYYDQVHLNRAGYAKKGKLLADFIMQ